jgi:hypothetical protein
MKAIKLFIVLQFLVFRIYAEASQLINFNSQTGTGTTANVAGVSAFRSSSASAGELGFFTNNGTILSEQMRIDEVGRVGIGPSNPSCLFHLAGADAGVMAYFDNISQGSGTGLLARVVTAAATTGNRYGLQGQAYGGLLYNEGFEGRVSGGTENFGIWVQSSGGASNYNIRVYGITRGTVGDYAGYFVGDLFSTGQLTKASGTFKIDHPMDPANKYLIHSFVENPDMMNVYNGNIATDANGDAIVQLPSYFEVENINFKYQLTVIGQFARAIVLEELSNNQFIIKTDKLNVKVSWKLTGVRNDKYAQEHRIAPEVEKCENEKGKYLHPQVFG